MDREAIAYMLFISSALYLKERNIKPFCQEALYIYCKRWHLLHQKVACYATKDGIFYSERWHLLHQRSVRYTGKGLLFYVKGLINPYQRAPSAPQETLIRESQASEGDNIHSLL